jgi:hypothetical protein
MARPSGEKPFQPSNGNLSHSDGEWRAAPKYTDCNPFHLLRRVYLAIARSRKQDGIGLASLNGR